MPPAMLFHVFPGSGVPIYRQLADQVRRLAATGKLREGDYLPSVRQVAQELQVNPMTVSKAYALLEREGVLENVRGQGMKLKTPAPAGSVKDRRQTLKPLLEQVVATAYQLALTPRQVIALLEPMLEDMDRERSE
ncbi:MAG: GntR family transcriptional regulator [Phycisphaeraceae bacterium]|nr:GntR family transcriptional regulator [Phycisphaeraceae bacterium]